MKHLPFVLILIFSSCKSQEEIIIEKRKTAFNFYDFLEKNEADSAISLVSKSFLRKNPTTKNDIITVASVISEYHIICEPVQSPFSRTRNMYFTETIYISTPMEDPNAKRFAHIHLAFKKRGTGKIHGVLIEGRKCINKEADTHNIPPPPPPPPPARKN